MNIVLPGGPVPKSLLHEATAFLRQKYVDGVCGIVQIFWNPITRVYFLHTPKQTGHKASVEFTRTLELENETSLIAEMSDHGAMPAYFSGLDLSDAMREVPFYVVLGRLDLPMPDYVYGTVNDDGKRMMLIESPFEV